MDKGLIFKSYEKIVFQKYEHKGFQDYWLLCSDVWRFRWLLITLTSSAPIQLIQPMRAVTRDDSGGRERSSGPIQ